jgi:5'-nucleotidase
MAVVAVLVLGASLSACGGDDDRAGATDAPSDAPSPSPDGSDGDGTDGGEAPEAGTGGSGAGDDGGAAPGEGSGDGGGDMLTVLVTNDDGVGAPGIDALVEALSVRDGTEVVVVAPSENQSGSGGRTTAGALQATDTATASGYPAVAVDGYPADSVVWALSEGGVQPDLVISGINEGQNVGPLVPLSGTVGAARQAAQMGVPALAVSQGLGDPPDYPTAVRSVLDWLEVQEAAVAAGALDGEQITSINVPTCPGAAVQGTLEVPVAVESSVDLNSVNCTSTVEPVDDVTAFVNGWIAVTPLPNTGSITG